MQWLGHGILLQWGHFSVYRKGAGPEGTWQCPALWLACPRDAWCHCLVWNSKLTTCLGNTHLHECSRVSQPVLEGDDHAMAWKINPFTSTQSDGAGLSAEALSVNLALQVPLGA